MVKIVYLLELKILEETKKIKNLNYLGVAVASLPISSSPWVVLLKCKFVVYTTFPPKLGVDPDTGICDDT